MMRKQMGHLSAEKARCNNTIDGQEQQQAQECSPVPLPGRPDAHCIRSDLDKPDAVDSFTFAGLSIPRRRLLDESKGQTCGRKGRSQKGRLTSTSNQDRGCCIRPLILIPLEVVGTPSTSLRGVISVNMTFGNLKAFLRAAIYKNSLELYMKDELWFHRQLIAMRRDSGLHFTFQDPKLDIKNMRMLQAFIAALLPRLSNRVIELCNLARRTSFQVTYQHTCLCGRALADSLHTAGQLIWLRLLLRKSTL